MRGLPFSSAFSSHAGNSGDGGDDGNARNGCRFRLRYSNIRMANTPETNAALIKISVTTMGVLLFLQAVQELLAKEPNPVKPTTRPGT
jgi:hypothetical protein